MADNNNNRDNRNNNNKNNNRMRGILTLVLWAVVLTVAMNYISAYSGNTANKTSSHEIKYSEMVDMVEKDQVKEILFRDSTIYITPVDGYTYTEEAGLCGLDGHTITCSRKSDVDLGYVGNVEKVDTTLIEHLLNDGFIPVIATVGMDENGIAYNINADTAAAAIAIALHAEKFVSMTDIVGLLYDKDDESTLIPEVEISEIEGYKAHGVISGGMIPKIEGMADAIYEGVHEAVIIDGRVPHSVLLEMFSDRGSGTLFYRRGNR